LNYNTFRIELRKYFSHRLVSGLYYSSHATSLRLKRITNANLNKIVSHFFWDEYLQVLTDRYDEVPDLNNTPLDRKQPVLLLRNISSVQFSFLSWKAICWRRKRADPKRRKARSSDSAKLFRLQAKASTWFFP